jgi:hypothetical protein
MLCDFQNCDKKLRLSDKIIGLCKCEKTFCLLHRLGEMHNCGYNHKSEIKIEEFIEKNKCVAEKTIKI